MTPVSAPAQDFAAVRAQLAARATELGFAAIGVTGVSGVQLDRDESRLLAWLAAGRHGDMHYMARHGTKRSRPDQLRPGTLRVISARMNYWPAESRAPDAVLADPTLGYVSRYALGRDYHRLMRRALKKLADHLEALLEPLASLMPQARPGPHGYRVFVDSAPVLEKALARNAGLGWIGKHTNLIARDAGSYFFLGEIYTDVPLPVDPPASAHCGSCTACLPACPTAAIVAPGQLDARRCISYLTIELKGPIPESLRPALGNRIYGCDDCQLVCPWNRYARAAAHPDFKVRHGLDAPRLSVLFGWTSTQFDTHMRGSAIYRLGFERWLRNIAVALGNAPSEPETVAALNARRDDPSALVREHVHWALERHNAL